MHPKAREGLVRAITSDTDTGFDAGKWKDASRRYRGLLGIALERKTLNAKVENPRKTGSSAEMNDAEYFDEGGERNSALLELGMARMLRCRIRYFTDGAVIGSSGFVDEVFGSAQQRFFARRKDGKRRMRGSGRAAAGKLWTVRDLRV